MKIFLIRHGESTGDIEDRVGGYYDDHLTEHGREQGKELAQQLSGKGIQIIFTSPLFRAQETSEEIRKVLDVPVEVVENLRERNNYGVLTGLTKTEAKEKHPADFEKISRDKTYHDVTNSESYEEITSRTLSVFADLLSKNFGTIAIISHGGVISTYVREFLDKGKNTKIGDCGFIEIQKEGEQFQVVSCTNAKIL